MVLDSVVLVQGCDWLLHTILLRRAQSLLWARWGREQEAELFVWRVYLRSYSQTQQKRDPAFERDLVITYVPRSSTLQVGTPIYL